MSDVTKVLAEVASAVVGHFDIKTLLDRIVETLKNTFHAEACSIFLEDKEKHPGIIKCVAGSGYTETLVNRGEYKKGEGFTGMVFETGNEFNIRNHEELSRGKWIGKYDGYLQPDGKSKYRNGMYSPLKIKEQTFGVIKVENLNKEEGEFFTDDEFVVFKTIANIIAIAIENTRLHQKAEEQSKTILSALSEVTNAVVGEFDMKTLLDRIIETTMNALNAEVCSIFLEDREKEPGVIKCVAGSGFATRIIRIAKYKIGEGLTGMVAQTGEVLNLSYQKLEEYKEKGKAMGKYDKQQWQSERSEYRNGMYLPLKIKDQILGVMKVENKRELYGNLFTNEDLAVFQTIANVIALTIEHASLHQKLEEQIKKEGDAWKEVSFRAGHKMGNALFGLRGNVDWLKVVFEEQPLDRAKMETTIRETQESLNIANSIIKEFKEYARPYQLNLELADINHVLEKAITEAEKSAHEVNFKREYDCNMPKTKIDIMRFKQCISELIENACLFMENKGQINVYSRISSGSDKQNMKVLREGDFISVIIKDTGKGVPMENKEKIFLPFFSTTATGSGLGLAIVEEYVKKHGGEITEIGECEKGAKFLIVLPIITN